jgi:predicted DCC family thiol-disulfide oxidoreductase YuxK
LFVFDGSCVLCSGGASWIMRRDRAARIAFTPAQGAIGQALYRHYGLEVDDTYLFVADGQGYGLSEGYFQVARVLGGMWRLAAVLRLIPRPLRDAAYRLVRAQSLPLVRTVELLRAADAGAARSDCFSAAQSQRATPHRTPALDSGPLAAAALPI